jgi:hypothetical protein
MSYPPPSISADKVNATVSSTDHPTHHNAMAAAINDIVSELGSNPSGAFATLMLRLSDMQSQIDALVGASSNTILNGTGAPSAGNGNNGDFWMRTSPTPMLYGPKAGGVWPAGVSLVGASGSGFLVLAAGESVPPGTAPGTLIARLPA